MDKIQIENPSRRRVIRQLITSGVLAWVAPSLLFAGNAACKPFFTRLQTAPVDGGFRMNDYWVWCGSVMKGEDGRFHMFSSRWSKTLSFIPHWLTNSEVVRATSDTPEGPYKFEQVVLQPREGYWDGKMTHNPTIHKCADTYLLFYTGTTYDGDLPTPGTQEKNMKSAKPQQARSNQRIGLATSKSIKGPWKRLDKPVLDSMPGKWDGLMTTNAAPCVLEDGSVLLVYKSSANQTDLLRMGVAKAEAFDKPFKRLSENPIFNFDRSGDHVEDGCVWREGGKLFMIMKDMNGGISGEKGGGILASSVNGVKWEICDPPKAYSRTIKWSDGKTITQGHLERPQVFIQDGKPTHVFFATDNGRGNHELDSRSWNMVIPLT
jgi:hypothetical protein